MPAVMRRTPSPLTPRRRKIWPWIVQIGQDRAGFYSYTQLENLFGCEMRNAGQIVPEWQERHVGDMVWMTPKRKFNGVGRWK
jgi:hypothetical protein